MYLFIFSGFEDFSTERNETEHDNVMLRSYVV